MAKTILETIPPLYGQGSPLPIFPMQFRHSNLQKHQKLCPFEIKFSPRFGAKRAKAQRQYDEALQEDHTTAPTHLLLSLLFPTAFVLKLSGLTTQPLH